MSEREPQEWPLEIETEIPKDLAEQIKERYEEWTREFREDDLQPLEFIAQTVESFIEKYPRSENIDVRNSFEIGMMLLAFLIEKGAEWDPNKKSSVRRVAIRLMQYGDITRFGSACDTLIPLLEARQEEIPSEEKSFVSKLLYRLEPC